MVRSDFKKIAKNTFFPSARLDVVFLKWKNSALNFAFQSEVRLGGPYSNTVWKRVKISKKRSKNNFNGSKINCFFLVHTGLTCMQIFKKVGWLIALAATPPEPFSRQVSRYARTFPCIKGQKKKNVLIIFVDDLGHFKHFIFFSLKKLFFLVRPTFKKSQNFYFFRVQA